MGALQDGDGDSINRHRCCKCAAVSPRTETNYTLISAQHRWRMVIQQNATGQREPIWFCPKCWDLQKRKSRL